MVKKGNTVVKHDPASHIALDDTCNPSLLEFVTTIEEQGVKYAHKLDCIRLGTEIAPHRLPGVPKNILYYNSIFLGNKVY
jgi:hypothetical protein